ncbi:MAG: hypothetical protein ACK56I_01635, partial [bacterium]
MAEVEDGGGAGRAGAGPGALPSTTGAGAGAGVTTRSGAGMPVMPTPELATWDVTSNTANHHITMHHTSHHGPTPLQHGPCDTTQEWAGYGRQTHQCGSRGWRGAPW